ncbi:membrane protein [Xenorhabdus beddingii]|uniref:Membrane protein n=1 Tax=Xenorhabdus beddingii TaxID=40578 RepID=A0A1Y2SJF4_9GAMM|nr:YpfN family protein [Xenorhabdus beddingii]OTA18890.1 membrane protein [Xenorhabdus beddingii]
MHWLIDYWWIVLLVLVGTIINAVKALSRVDQKRFLDNKPELPPHRDLNDQWDDEDDWSQQNRKK